LYRHVEALSVTPYAVRAVDRGLTALLVALVRQLDPTWNGEIEAESVDLGSALVKEAVEIIRERALGVSSRQEVGEDVVRSLATRIDQWREQQAVEGRVLAYKGRRDGASVGLLRGAGVSGWDTWTCLTSLRDVEPGINLILDDDDLGERSAPAYELAAVAEHEETAEEAET
jgi:hypothetical protein